MAHFYIRFLYFIFGVTLGLYLGYKHAYVLPKETNKPVLKLIPSYENWSSKLGIKRKLVPWDELRYSNTTYILEADYLFKKVKIACIIIVRTPKNLEAAKNTWAKGCNYIKTLETLPKVKKPLPAKRSKENSSWILLCKSLFEVPSNYSWVLVVNDNTFAIMENLRFYIAPLNPSNKYYLGHAVKFWSTIYNSNEAGYLLSRGTIGAFQDKYLASECLSNIYWNREDFYLGKYLAKLNITPTDTRDEIGYSRFHPYNWYHVLFPGESYYKTSVFPVRCCSKHSITFQAIEADKMYTYNYLLYKLQIFTDGKIGNKPFVSDIPDEKIWKTFLKERNIHNDVSAVEYYKLWEDLIEDPTSFAAHMKKELHFDYD